MANPIYGQNKADNFQDLQVITVDSPALSIAGTIYAAMPWDCTVVSVYWAANVALTTALSTLTLKTAQGTCGGTHTIAHLSAIGSSGKLTPTSNNVVLAGGTMEIENDAAPGAGQVTFTIVCQVV